NATTDQNESLHWGTSGFAGKSFLDVFLNERQAGVGFLKLAKFIQRGTAVLGVEVRKSGIVGVGYGAFRRLDAGLREKLINDAHRHEITEAGNLSAGLRVVNSEGSKADDFALVVDRGTTGVAAGDGRFGLHGVPTAGHFYALADFAGGDGGLD